ncbi:MAG: hypothetical protein P8M78_12560 [Myxococcota bacterium]|jgi:hypothetical protein|nr:hypothetical protein [Myxococcota bacterium]
MKTIDEYLSRFQNIQVLVLLVALMGTSAGAWADELPIVLSNQNVGMSGSEIEASQPSTGAAEAPAPKPAVKKPESDDSTSEFVSAEPSGVTKPANPAPSGVTTYPDCVEKAIRGGADYDASAKVCRILFPESSS